MTPYFQDTFFSTPAQPGDAAILMAPLTPRALTLRRAQRYGMLLMAIVLGYGALAA
ncbi:hypothetical protein [Yoonia sp.]|jgi:hypothetical protein|uniref:hypothetical protein n=1 Tax=Yoonia sp. TaxID=2212373 RepID=UPI0025F0C017|nr:hypothetical protein [Yoonia sp.]